MEFDKNILFDGFRWIINGENDGILSHPSNTLHPPYSSFGWTHSSIPGVTDANITSFHVDIKCVSTFAPISVPTDSPTPSPSISPTLSPINHPTTNPTPSPSNNPTSSP